MARLAPALLCIAAVACRDPTEIRLSLSTDVACERISGTRIDTGAPGAPPSRATGDTLCAADGSLGSIVLVPSGSKGDRVRIEVTTALRAACDGGPCTIVARRVLRYVPHSILPLDVAMQSACADVTCPADQTCVNGRCESAIADDPGYLGGPDAGPVDAGPSDSGPSDAADDGGRQDAALPCAPGPEVHVAGVPQATWMALSANDVFWTELPYSSTVWRASRGAGAKAEALVSGEQSPGLLAASSRTLYWADMGPVASVRALDFTGTAGPRTIAPSYAYDLTADADDVYFTTDHNEVRRGALATPLAVSSGASFVVAMGGSVYFLDAAGIQSVPKDASAGARLVFPRSDVTFLRTDGVALYWFEAQGASLYRWTTATGAPALLQQGLDRPTNAPALTSIALYYASASRIWKVPMAPGAAPVALASTGSTGAVTADDACVYFWSGVNGGTIFRVAP